MALTWDELGTILRRAKTVAVVGLSNNPERTSHEIASYLKGAGYRIIPVNPTITEALGEKAYPSLRDIAEKIDVVLIFRRPSEVPAIIDDAIAVGGRAPSRRGCLHAQRPPDASGIALDACHGGRARHRPACG